MNLDDLIIAVFCETDDTMNVCLQQLPKACLCERGSVPTVCDSGVLCLEAVGAYLGLEQDQAIYERFVRHYSRFFPALSRVRRTTFTRQATRLVRLNNGLRQNRKLLEALFSIPEEVTREERSRTNFAICLSKMTTGAVWRDYSSSLIC